MGLPASILKKIQDGFCRFEGFDEFRNLLDFDLAQGIFQGCLPDFRLYNILGQGHLPFHHAAIPE